MAIGLVTEVLSVGPLNDRSLATVKTLEGVWVVEARHDALEIMDGSK